MVVFIPGEGGAIEWEIECDELWGINIISAKMLVDVVGCINSKKCTKMCLNIVFVAQFEIDVWHGFFLEVSVLDKYIS